MGVFCAEGLLRLINCPAVLLKDAALYFRLYFSGVPFLMLYNFCAAVHYAAGDSRRPMTYLIVGGAVKLLVSYLLVAGLHMGVSGVAVSTIVGWGITAALSLHALKGNSSIRLCLGDARFYGPELSRILRVGIPVGLQQGLFCFANVAITATVNGFGPAATTGISIANNYDGVLYQVCTATSLAVMPYVSQNVCAGKLKRAMESVWKGILITVALGASSGAAFAVFSPQLSSLMTSDPQVIGFSQQKMIIISSTYFICGINDIICAALRGMGRPVAPTVSTLVFLFGLRFAWVYFVFPLRPNLTFLYLCWPVSWVLSIGFLLVVFFRQRKQLLQGSLREIRN
jgi:Na+-driven multidrug efflux pump